MDIDNPNSPSSRLNRKVSVGCRLKQYNTIAIVWFVTVKQQNTNLLSDKTDALFIDEFIEVHFGKLYGRCFVYKYTVK